jgi:hypothetical protein
MSTISASLERIQIACNLAIDKDLLEIAYLEPVPVEKVCKLLSTCSNDVIAHAPFWGGFSRGHYGDLRGF